MSADMRAALAAVAVHFPTAIISGRGLDKVTSFVALPQLFYAASHGLDIRGPNGVYQPVPWARPLMDAVHDALVARLRGVDGAQVEHNQFCVSVHYRRARAGGRGDRTAAAVACGRARA